MQVFQFRIGENRLIYSLLLLAAFGCAEEPRSSDGEASGPAVKLFELQSPATTGVTFNARGQLLYPGDETGLYSNISGLAVGDINNDGLPDLFFSGGRGNSKLYLNRGDFRFEDITQSAGIRDEGANNADNQGVNMVDINGDGWLDIYILKTGIKGNFQQQQFTKDGANLLYVNQQDNTFKEQAAAYGLDIIGLSHTANFFDYDGDGDLDLYMIHTGEPGATFSFSYYEAPPRSKWLNDQLLENRNGKFVDVREQAGLPYRRNIGLSASVGDVNNDGYADIYVANDFFGPDFFYLNNGDGTFSEKLQDYFTKTPMSAMGSDFADINNDGWIDLFTGEMMPATQRRQKLNLVPFSIEAYNKLEEQGNPQYTRNMLQANDGGERFRDIGLFAGVYATEWSWSSFFFDADNDGFKDLYIANGILRDMTNMDFVKSNFGEDYTSMADPQAKAQANPREAPSVKTSNYLFRNQDGLNFEDESAAWGLSQPVHTRGATYADLDGDGDLDLVLNNINESPYLYRNLAEQLPAHNYLRLRLQGKGSNTFGIGAAVRIFYQGRRQMGYLSTQRGFQSCPEPVLHFGLAEASTVDTLVATWPGGQQEAWYNLTANQLLSLKQGEGEPIQLPPEGAGPKLLEEKPGAISFQHRERPFTDYRIERLLIRKYSEEGPGMAVADVNQDGLDDCFAGGAAGMAGQLFLQGADGKMTPAPNQPWASETMMENMGVVFFDANGDGAPDLYLSSGSNEFQAGAPALQDRIFLNDGTGRYTAAPNALPAGQAYTSIVAAADFDADGDTDLFTGARMTPGNYSQVPVSALLRNDGGRFSNATAELAPGLATAGRVTAALWTDADSDGDLDLAVVGEWMPFTVFFQEDGSFRKEEAAVTEGWWNSLLGADLDNDGDMDYVAGNHGQNSIFKASPEKPVSLVTGDFDQNGKPDPLVFRYSGGVNAPFANRDIFTSQMPAFNNQFYSFARYAEATFNNLLDEQTLANSVVSEAYQLQSCVFLNEGGGQFRAIPLPAEAQLAPIYGLLAQDVNEDGKIDLLVSGNTYSEHYEYGSIDALGGRLLIGQGDGSFTAIPELRSGFDIARAGRSMTLLYHKHSATPIIMAANNDGPLQAFEWPTEAQPVRFPEGATHAIVSLKDGKQQRWEYYQGGGYLSQSANVLFKTKAVESIAFYRGDDPLGRALLLK